MDNYKNKIINESLRGLLLQTDDKQKFIKMMEIMPMVDIKGFIIFNLPGGSMPTNVNSFFDYVEIDEDKRIVFSRYSTIKDCDHDFELCIPENDIKSVTPYDNDGVPTVDVDLGATTIAISFFI